MLISCVFFWFVIVNIFDNLDGEYLLFKFFDILFKILGFLIIFLYVFISWILFWIFCVINWGLLFLVWFIKIWVLVWYLGDKMKNVIIVLIIKNNSGKIIKIFKFFCNIFLIFVNFNVFFIIYFF